MLGIISGSDKGLSGTATDTFAGQTIHATDSIVMYTYGGDANLDGHLDIDDYTAIDSAVSDGTLKGWFNGDFNYDGLVDIDDYTIIDSNLGAQGAPFSTARGGVGGVTDVTAVPEPTAALAAVVFATPAMLGRRRRRR